MARSTLRDFLHDSNFWLFDVAPVDSLALPIFTPMSGFSSISAPELTLETNTISEGNAAFPTYVVKGASIGPVTLTRGVTFANSDFWRWVKSAVSGGMDARTAASGLASTSVFYRRSLLLVHFFRNFGFPGQTPGAQAAATTLAAAVVGQGLLSAVSSQFLGGDYGGGLAAMAANFAAYNVWNGVSEGVDSGIRVPARAFLLENCIPTRYKTGSDFDATSGQVSVAELEVQPEYVEEISLAS